MMASVRWIAAGLLLALDAVIGVSASLYGPRLLALPFAIGLMITLYLVVRRASVALFALHNAVLAAFVYRAATATPDLAAGAWLRFGLVVVAVNGLVWLSCRGR